MFGIDDIVAGGVAGLFSQAPQMLFNARQAAISRDWQENLANTQIQRRVADANAAGINPIFAVAGGAGAAVPGGAQASVGPGPDLLSSAKQASMMDDQVATVAADRKSAENNAMRTYWDAHSAEKAFGLRNAEMRRSWDTIDTDVAATNAENVARLSGARSDQLQYGLDSRIYGSDAGLAQRIAERLAHPVSSASSAVRAFGGLR